MKHPYQYPNSEQINAFIIDLRCARFIYCPTFVRTLSFSEAFLRKEATLESRIIGAVGIIEGLDIVIIINNRGIGVVGEIGRD